MTKTQDPPYNSRLPNIMIDDRVEWEKIVNTRLGGAKLGRAYIDEMLVAEFVSHILQRYLKRGVIIGFVAGLMLSVTVASITRAFF
jgi:hypothetical protein